MPRVSKDIDNKKNDIVETKIPKKVTRVSIWFQDHCTENISDIKHICNLTARTLDEDFGMYSKSNNTEVFAVVFFATFISILKYIAGKQKTYKNYSIQIFNSINIGYTNNENDDNEKVGNFTPIFEYVGTNKEVVKDPDDGVITADKMEKKFSLWKTINSKKNVEQYKEIQEMAFQKLIDEFKVDLRYSESIFPIFCTFFDHIIAVLKLKYREAEGTDIHEIKLNILGLFDIYYSFDEENGEIIDFEPNITSKLTLKNDEVALVNVD